MKRPKDTRLQKHIAYWVTLSERDREEFRREWAWFADLLDRMVKKYVGEDKIELAYYQRMAVQLQVADHFSAVGTGSILPEIPSLSAPNRMPDKGKSYYIRKKLAG